jgi:parvulin-like peptidyl-prolyl isomerase
MALVVAGGVAERSLALPAPEDLAPNTVALVSDVPAKRKAITIAEFRHSMVLIATQKDRRTVPRPGSKEYVKVERQVMASLLEIAWIYGEAAEMGIAVTRAQVARELALFKKENFKSSAEYRQFLKESHYTRRDVYERLEIQMLAARLRRRIARRIERQSRNEYEEQQAFKEFLTEFTERWRGRTVCAPEYATDLCSNGPPPAAKAERPAGSRAGGPARTASARSVPSVGVSPSQARALRPFFLPDPFLLLSVAR